MLEICQLHRRLRDEGVSRAQIVEQLATVAGTYVPSLYEVRYDEPCSPHGYTVPREGKDVPPVVYKRVVEDFGATNPLSQSCVPTRSSFTIACRSRFCAAVPAAAVFARPA